LDAPAVVAENIQLRRERTIPAGETDWRHAVSEARSEFLQLAAQYTRQYRDLDADPVAGSPDRPLLLAGHQPQLFHVGVWSKNFVLDRLARRTQGIAVHLIIDNDLAGTVAIRVPAGTAAAPRLEMVAYDRASTDAPYEERLLLDRSLFDSFADRVRHSIEPLVSNPLLRDWWPRVVRDEYGDANLGRRVAQARHQLEAAWGLRTLELPLSMACETRGFRQFVLQLLGEPSRLLRDYNDSLHEFRRANRVRSRSHPVPELELADGWHEAPLWIWTREDPRRRRLFARRRPGFVDLTDRGNGNWTIPGRAEDALEELTALAQRGVRIRPRALTTTMYARLILCDLFVHGVGGGKYDQLTDAILRAWLGIEPPRFQVVTATAQLPIARPPVTQDDLRRVDRILRDMTFNPDRYVAEVGPPAALAAEKRAWLAREPHRGAGRERHLALERINAELRTFVADRRSELQSDRDRLDELLRHERLLGSREFAFCLFPEATLRHLLLDNA
jgi:hypothetical protein